MVPANFGCIWTSFAQDTRFLALGSGSVGTSGIHTGTSGAPPELPVTLVGSSGIMEAIAPELPV